MLRLKTLFRLLRRLVVLVCITAVLLMALPPLAREADRLLYPRKYSRQVEQWAAEYELDPLLVYAFIRTPIFRPGFTCLAVLRNSRSSRRFHLRDSHTLWLAFPCHSINSLSPKSGPYPGRISPSGLPSSAFARHY